MATPYKQIGKSALGYDQSQVRETTANKNQAGSSIKVDASRDVRDLKSTTSSTGSKVTTSSEESGSEKLSTNKGQSVNTSTQKANIAFTLSFSIPMTGIVPTNCHSGMR